MMTKILSQEILKDEPASICINTDGNCFMRSISRLIYGNGDRHLKMRCCIVLDCVKNIKNYTSHDYLMREAVHMHKNCHHISSYCCDAPSWLLSLNPFTEFRIWNNSLSSDVLYILASISISPKYESKSKTTSHCHLLLHDCTNVAV